MKFGIGVNPLQSFTVGAKVYNLVVTYRESDVTYWILQLVDGDYTIPSPLFLWQSSVISFNPPYDQQIPEDIWRNEVDKLNAFMLDHFKEDIPDTWTEQIEYWLRQITIFFNAQGIPQAKVG